MADIEIEIDGRLLKAEPNQNIIHVADAAGIYIPRFCYHKHLSIPANCRMCLVEVEKMPKAVPACATPCTPGMKVFTKSNKTLSAQRAVMEFLLINHPLDCPICDQGGECELQDLSMGYGSSHSDYDECKRSIADQNLGPLIATEMTRCIACTRCVRFGDEVAGLRELGVIGRGEDVEISTYVQHVVKSEVSGNIIDLCPVGALTSKPYRFTARPWELNQSPSVSPHDCIGSSLNVHTRYGKVMRVVSREDNINPLPWIADRDRYSYTGLYHADRLEEPLVKIDGKWEVVNWQRAFEIAATKLQESITQFGVDKLGALASPNSTLEEFYLLQKLMRALGSSHIDHRLREIDTKDQAERDAFPSLGMTLAELESFESILLIGSNITKEQPIAGVHVRKATLKGATVIAINPVDYHFNFKVTAKKIMAPHHLVHTLSALITAYTEDCDDKEIQTIIQQLKAKPKTCILLGALANHHPEAAQIRAFAQQFAQLTGAKLGFLTEGANSAGAWIAGAIPHRHAGGLNFNHVGLNAYEMLQKPRKAYLLLNVEPDLDTANAHHAIEALKQAKCVIALSMFRNPVLEQHAHVILPMAAFTETSGTYVSAMGAWQTFTGVAKPFAESRPAWKILRVLGNFLQLEGFDYQSSEEVLSEVKALAEKMQVKQSVSSATAEKTEKSQGLSRIGEVPLYAVDSLVRRALPLQSIQTTLEGDMDVVRMHPETASRHHLQEGDNVRIKQHCAEVILPLQLDDRIALDAVWIAGGIVATQGLGDLFGEVELSKSERS